MMVNLCACTRASLYTCMCGCAICVTARIKSHVYDSETACLVSASACKSPSGGERGVKEGEEGRKSHRVIYYLSTTYLFLKSFPFSHSPSGMQTEHMHSLPIWHWDAFFLSHLIFSFQGWLRPDVCLCQESFFYLFPSLNTETEQKCKVFRCKYWLKEKQPRGKIREREEKVSEREREMEGGCVSPYTGTISSEGREKKSG